MSPIISSATSTTAWAPYTWTPSLYTTDGTMQASLGANGSITGSFEVQGDRVTGTLTILFGGTGLSYGTSGLDYYVEIPVPADTVAVTIGAVLGAVAVGDTGTDRKVGAAIYNVINSTPVMQFRTGSSTFGNVGSTFPYGGTLAYIRAQFSYRADRTWLADRETLTAGQGYTFTPKMFTAYRSENVTTALTPVDPATPTGQQPVGQTGYTLAMSEEFNGIPSTFDALSDTVQFHSSGPVWQTRYRDHTGLGHTNNSGREKQWYTGRQVTTDGAGNLLLTATKDARHTDTGLPYSSGLIHPWPSFTFQYGYLEARLKADRVAGAWPAFWMLAGTYGWPPEVDILEQFGTAPAGTITTWFNPASGAGTGTLNAASNGAVASQWHVYGCKWTSARLDFYIDGALVQSETNAGAVPQTPMYPLLNVAVDGSQSIDDAHFPITMAVDYLRVWQ